ncbi:MAG TPA: YfcE family phosphodiesterase [Phycisphaerae bacterium]|nr:YfcE family phosphodiesterase [Phycisphaerae bacterium]HRW51394.1 YfcE family phosphodiesterase [Phycisphaerae bacterium]
MRIGIMSDSHGDAGMTRQAIALLSREGATRLIHCGDICGMSVLDELAGRDCVFVWGNCDRVDASMRAYLRRVGLPWPESPVRLTIAGKRIAVAHGHEWAFDSLADDESLDYILHGHTHVMKDARENGCRVINPGALYRASPHTVALLDLESDDVTFFEVETGRVVEL